MTIVTTKPTSPGRRFLVKNVDKQLHKGKPFYSLVVKKGKTGGRNNQGRITVRHRGGGHKKNYRVVDFKRNKFEVPAVVERIEYDPNRTANIALLKYLDGDWSYIIAPKGLEKGSRVISSETASISVGNCLPLRSVPIGTELHCVELRPGKGAQLARAAGASVQLIAREGDYATLRLRSGEMRKVHIDCRAVIGSVGNVEHNLLKFGKAGAVRWRGIRPTVRGVAMNPVDHPHGGGEGRTSGGRHPVTPWGQPTKGYKTRRNKRTDNMIIKRRGLK